VFCSDQKAFIPFAKDSPALVGGTAVWLCSGKAHFLSGRYVNSNWSMDDLLEREEEIEASNKLKIDLVGTFVVEQLQ
jgi:hypothetical protein